MAYIYTRIRQANKRTKEFDILLPQTVTRNVLRNDRMVLEDCLINYDRHIENDLIHFIRTKSMGGTSSLIINIPDTDLKNGLALLIELHIDLGIEPTISYNGGPPEYIITSEGDKIAGGQIEGSFILVVYNALMKKWLLLNNDHDNSLTHVMVPTSRQEIYVSPENNTRLIVIPGFNHNTETIVVNYNQTVLRYKIDYNFVGDDTLSLLNFGLDAGESIVFTITSYQEIVRKGSFNYSIEETIETYICNNDGMRIVPLPEIPEDMYCLMVNYNQTVLRSGIDYADNGNGSITMAFPINKGDVICFNILRYVEKNGTVVAPNGGSTGSYRYNIKVLHEEFTASKNNTIKISIPNFNRSRDELSVIFKNHLLIKDVDYIVDELNDIILTTMELNADETIYFTILQGAVIDVPKFNYCEIYGDGKDMKADISYSELHDFYTLMVRPRVELKDSPTLKLLDGPKEPIVDANFHPISGGNLSGTFLYLVKNQTLGVWQVIGGLTQENNNYNLTGISKFPSRIMIPADPSKKFAEVAIYHGLGKVPTQVRITPIEPPNIESDGTVTYIGDYWAYADANFVYVGNTGTATSKFRWEVSDASLSGAISLVEQVTNRVDHIEEIINKLGIAGGMAIEMITYNHTITDISSLTIEIPNFNRETDILIVNYMQSMLRENIDYTVPDSFNGIKLLNITPREGSIVTFIIIKPKTTEEKVDVDEESI